MTRFANRTVAVTGAAGNLGRAVAARFAREGARLLLIDVDAERAAKLGSELPGDHLGIAVDLLDAAAVQAAIADAAGKLGAVDVAVALAGGFDMGPAVHETDAAVWERMHRLNLGTLLPLLAAVTPAMIARGSGKIVTVGAHAALKGVAGMGAYCASKASVMRVTESAAAELRGHGINVNCVLPTILDTPQNRAAMPKADPSHWVSPDALAAVIAFLASDDARAVHGALLPVTGLS
ncbi:SDR family NAD(P)-dependent oxidoreductase [Thalassobaculum sp.]|uniref:SDR family NAD(P)-dependent oxidoreductase n=1 Tax=Thalassobaculum sp. TaxID=2022740 RepID=UPI0032F086A4